MILVGPVAADLGDLVVREPDEQIEHVGRLVDQYAARWSAPPWPSVTASFQMLGGAAT